MQPSVEKRSTRVPGATGWVIPFAKLSHQTPAVLVMLNNTSNLTKSEIVLTEYAYREVVMVYHAQTMERDEYSRQRVRGELYISRADWSG